MRTEAQGHDTMQDKIIIKGLRIFARYGVMEQESRVGAYFTIDLYVEADIREAVDHDILEGTISYATLYDIAKREMAVRSQLLEHAAGRIAKAIINECPKSKSVLIRMTKENPPMGAECSGAGVELYMARE